MERKDEYIIEGHRVWLHRTESKMYPDRWQCGCYEFLHPKMQSMGECPHVRRVKTAIAFGEEIVESGPTEQQTSEPK